MRPAPLALLVLALLGAGAGSASAATLEQARAAVQSAEQRAHALDAEGSALQRELDQLATEIEAKKASRGSAMLAGDALEGALRRSQELAAKLHGHGTARAQAAERLTQANRALAEQLDAALGAARADVLGARDRDARAKALARLTQLRTERDAAWARLPGAGRLPSVGEPESDDPDELLAQADALRDSEDKVRQRLAAVRARVATLEKEAELDRRLGDFLGDEALFDEQDRRLKVQRDATTGAISAAPSSTRTFGPVSADSASAPPPGASAPPENAGAPGPATQGGQTPSYSAPGAPAIASDGRPQLGASRRPDPERDDLESLQREAAALEREAAGLSGRARELETRARQQ